MVGISRLYCGVHEASDALRYGSGRGRLSNGKPIVVWNCTRRCNLRCMHCYARAGDAAPSDELTTGEGIALLEDLARFGAPVALFSGGEPLLRPDIFDLIAAAARLGLRAVLSTNGTLITPDTAARLKETGIGYVGVSLDGTRGTNDRFRGMEGAYDKAMAGIRNCLEAGVKVGIRFTVTRGNAADLPAIFDLVRDEGIPRVCVYHLVYAGRGATMMADDLDAAATRCGVDLIIDRTAQLHAQGRRTEVLTVDNHADGAYLCLRMKREGHPGAGRALELLRANGGNASGERIGGVSWDGTVHADQFWRHVSLGNVRDTPFSRIWGAPGHPLLQQLRNRRAFLTGRCAKCRFLDICNGNFRVRAEAATGNLWACDPACYLTDDEVRPEAAGG